MKLLLLVLVVPLIGVVAVANGVESEGPEDVYSLDYTGATDEPLNTPFDMLGNRMLNFEDGKGQNEIELQMMAFRDSLNATTAQPSTTTVLSSTTTAQSSTTTAQPTTAQPTTAQPSTDCESNGGECKSKKLCEGPINTEYTCSNTNVCCMKGASDILLQVLANAISIQGKALQIMKENQERIMRNISNTISNQGIELQIMKKNLTDAFSNEAMALQTMKSNLSDSISNQGMALKVNQDSIMSNLSDGFSNQENMIEIMEDNQDIIMQNLTHLGCPEGFFRLSPSNQCFKYFSDQLRTYFEANSTCQSKGLKMARPSDPEILRKYLVTKYGYYNSNWPNVWLPARGTGSYFHWPNGGRLDSNNPYWKAYPSSYTSSAYCVYMMNDGYSLKTYPNKPFYYSTCTGRSYYTICELVKE